MLAEVVRRRWLVVVHGLPPHVPIAILRHADPWNLRQKLFCPFSCHVGSRIDKTSQREGLGGTVTVTAATTVTTTSGTDLAHLFMHFILVSVIQQVPHGLEHASIHEVAVHAGQVLATRPFCKNVLDLLF